MADTDLLPSRGVTFEALVDSTGVAINGSSTVAQLASKGMRAACAVDGTGTAITGGGSLAQIAAAGIRAFCAVDQNGVAQDASTADQLRARGIRPRVLLDATGVALNGSAGQAVLASRGLQSFCPVDESGNATTMGAVILISNTNVFDNIAVGATVGTLSVAGGSGTYTFTLTSNPGSLFVTAGTNGVNLNTATALTAGSYPVTVQAAGGVPTPISRALSITVSQAPTLPANTAIPVISGTPQVGQTLTTTNGTWTGFPAPTFTYQWNSVAVVTTYATFNPADLSNITLSGGNLTALGTAGGSGVRGTISLSSGKYYLEYTYTTINTNSLAVGLALASASLTGTPATGIANIARTTGTINVNGSGSGISLGIINVGTVVGIAVDLTAKLIWFRFAPAGNWNNSGTANPATGVGGISITTISTGPLYPLFSSGTSDKCTANFGASAFVGAVPSGFTAGWPQ